MLPAALGAAFILPQLSTQAIHVLARGRVFALAVVTFPDKLQAKGCVRHASAEHRAANPESKLRRALDGHDLHHGFRRFIAKDISFAMLAPTIAHSTGSMKLASSASRTTQARRIIQSSSLAGRSLGRVATTSRCHRHRYASQSPRRTG